MSDQQHAAAHPGPGPGPGSGASAARGPDAGPRDPGPAADARADTWADTRADAPAATAAPAGEEPRAPGEGRAHDDAVVPEVPRRFRRDPRHKMLGGVCAGLGRQCDMDPVIFRIVLAVLAATGGLGLIFYGFAWLFVPYDDEEENEVRKLLTGRVDGQALAGVLFALVGCGVFLSMLNNASVLTFAATLSLLLAGAGYWSRQRGTDVPDPSPSSRVRSGRGGPIAAQAVADAPPEAQAPPVPAAFPSWWREPIVKDGTYEGGTGYLWGPKGPWERDIAAAITIAHGGGPDRGIRPRDAKPRGPRGIGGRVFLLALLAGALVTRLTWDDHTLGVSLQAGLASALAVFGLGIAVSSFRGRTGAGSVFLAIVTAGLLACSAALPADITTHWERVDWTPATAAVVQEQYDLGTGVGTLDLSRIDPGKGRTVTTNAEVGMGQLKVVIPKDVTVRLNIDVGVGDIQLPGDDQRDVDVAPGKHKELTLAPVDGSKDGGTLDLTLEVGLGQAEVARAAS
ncbi:PspC domain-containing protein [Streptomyces ortus]|uniref:PspC domain-containing protein n=1 Tax=Streptomyces ortus TaxID=2867268 RepID=A0ABT3V2H5_9ACTN|nr:PspC domain-containing protein [Streptomyces ortus]MCX4233973.1 PspC domain-containing protein [Streptomyces ortus]